MKIKLLVWLSSLILGKAYADDEPRADMYLPVWLLAFSMVLMCGGIILGIAFVVTHSVGTIVAAVIAMAIGICALLSWKNQSILIVSDSTFEYTTFLGNKKVYRFQDIKGIRQNKDSMTMFVGNEKVHIENAAIMTERLIDKINERLNELYANE